MAIKIKNRDPKYTDFSANDIVINRKTGTLFFKNEQEIIKIQSASLLDNVNVSDTLTAHSSSFTHITSPDKDIVKHSTSGIAKTTFIKPGIGNVSIENGFTVDNYKINPAFANPAQIGSTFVVGPTLNIKGGIGADNLDVKGRISADSFIGDGSKLTNLPTGSSGESSGGSGWDGTTDVTLSSGKTLDVSNGTFTTSTAQKKAIVDGAGHLEVMYSLNGVVNNYGSVDDPDGGGSAVNDWYGPREMGGEIYSRNYGNDTQVLTLREDRIVAGIIVPFACILKGFQIVVSHQSGMTAAATGVALYYGDFQYANGSSGVSSFDITSGTATDLTLVQATNCLATLSTPGAIGNPVTAQVTNGTTQLAAQDMIYPRIKYANIDVTNKDIYFYLNILVSRL